MVKSLFQAQLGGAILLVLSSLAKYRSQKRKKNTLTNRANCVCEEIMFESLYILHVYLHENVAAKDTKEK